MMKRTLAICLLALPVLTACSAPHIATSEPSNSTPSVRSSPTPTPVYYDFTACGHDIDLLVPEGWEQMDKTFVPANIGLEGAGVQDDNDNVIVACYEQPGLDLEALKAQSSTDFTQPNATGETGAVVSQTATKVGDAEAYEYVIDYPSGPTQQIRVSVTQAGTPQAVALLVTGTIQTDDNKQTVVDIMDAITIS